MPSMMDKFKAWLKRQPDDPEAAKLAEFLDNQDDDSLTSNEGPILRKVGVIDFSSSPEYQALKAKLEAQEKQLATFAISQSSQTAQKALARIEGKVTPAQKPALLAMFTQAAQDDADAQVVSFSVEGQDKPFEGSRVEAMLAVFSGLGDISLTTELLDKDEHATFAASKKEASKGLNPYDVAENYKKQQEGK